MLRPEFGRWVMSFIVCITLFSGVGVGVGGTSGARVIGTFW